MVPDVAPGDGMGVQVDGQAAASVPHVSVAGAGAPAVPGGHVP
jgi:hypothetical protein